MKKELYVYIPLLVLTIGELSIFFGNSYYGLGIHLVNLLAIILIAIFSPIEIKEKNILQALTLPIILRIINISMPQFFTTTFLQYPLIYGIMFIPIYQIIKVQQMSSNEIGLNFKKLHIYLPLAFQIGIAVAFVEYMILNPEPLISKIRLSDIILLSIIMIVFIGTIEETIFRSIIQTRIEKVFGTRNGILLSGSIFGIMHTGYGIIDEVMFASIYGIFIAIIFQKTRNLPFIISIHGISNVMLYGVFPFIL